MSDSELVERALDAWEAARDAGRPAEIAAFCPGRPDLVPRVLAAVAALRRLDPWLEPPAAGGDALRPGDEVAPGYQLGRPLGRGGFGVVWEATGPGGLAVAVKVLHPDRADAEARSLAVVRDARHPHLLALHGVWEHHGRTVLAMERADGTLADRLRGQRAVGLAVATAEALAHVRDAADGLDHLHRFGVVHRDVKPSNLLLVGGRVKVGDFGLATVAGSPYPQRAGATPGYAAPEALRGFAVAASDQYSLAVTYVELLTGRPPAADPTDPSPAPDLSGLPPRALAAVARATARDPAARWPSCHAFADALADGGRHGGRHRRGVLVGGVVAAVSLAAGGWALWGRPAAPAPQSTAAGPTEFARGTHGFTSLDLRDGRVAAVTTGGRVAVWGWPSGQPLHAWPDRPPRPLLVRFLPDPDEVLVAPGVAPFEVTVRATRDGRVLRTLGGHEQLVRPLVVSADGRTAATGGHDGAVGVWDLGGGGVRRHTGHFRACVNGVDLLPDGRVVSGADDGRLLVWDGTPHRCQLLSAHASPVWAVAAAPGGREVASGDKGGAVILVRLAPPVGVRLRLNVGGPVQALQYSPDGTRLAVASGWTAPPEPPVVSVWDAATGEKVGEHRRHTLPVFGVCFTPDGGELLTAADDGTILRWPVPHR